MCAVWRDNNLQPDIRDIDWIEALLFRHADVRSRFFPQFIVLLPDPAGPLQIGFEGAGEMVELTLRIRKFGQTVPLRVPAGLSVLGLVELLVQKLRLPTHGRVHSIGSDSFDISWKLFLVDSDEPLNDDTRLGSLGGTTTVELGWSLRTGESITGVIIEA